MARVVGVTQHLKPAYRRQVSQPAVSVLTNRNYIRRLLGRVRYHMLPKPNTSLEDSTEIVDVAAIDTRYSSYRGRS